MTDILRAYTIVWAKGRAQGDICQRFSDKKSEAVQLPAVIPDNEKASTLKALVDPVVVDEKRFFVIEYARLQTFGHSL